MNIATAFLPRLAAPAATTALYAGVLMGSAVLIFWIQPYFARALLPHAGGAAAVWLVALVFFQGALLAGYAWAHLLRLYLPLKGQMTLHLLLLGIGAVWFLPPGLAPDFALDSEAAPALGLIAALILHLGLPFAVLSATAPLLQHWFASRDHPQADNPYWLYAASNAGSLAALIAYPFLIEPALTLGAQGRLWSALYLLVAAATVLAGLSMLAAPRRAPARPAAGAAPRGAWAERAGWLLYASVPTALLAAVTTHLTTDVAPFPLLWVLPLALYLSTFIAAFAGFPKRPALAQRAAGPALALLVVSIWFAKTGFLWMLAVHLLAFTALALACHAALYARRPAPERLTEFYLFLALGGVGGTALTAFLPPLIFSWPLEYPLLLALACLALPDRARAMPTSRAGALNLLRALGAVALGILAIAALPDPGGYGATGMALLFAVIAAIVGLVFLLLARLPALLALVLLAAWFGGPNRGGETGSTVWSGRSFFGSYSVFADPAHQGFHFMSGTTAHGFEKQDPHRDRPEPATYYHAHGPLGQMMRGMGARFERLGVLGLGIGNMACHARPGQRWTFYEIDPLVAELARDRRFFHSLTNCTPEARIVTGDGRLQVAAEPASAFDFLAMDAFSSNAVPVHLITREAFEIYNHALAEGGVILVNISNRYLDLAPVVARAAGEAGFLALEQNFEASPTGRDEVLALSSRWVALARETETLDAVAATGPWTQVRGTDRAPLWTDDHASLFGALY